MAERMSLHYNRNYPLHLGMKAAVLIMFFSATAVLGSQVQVSKRVDAVLGKNVTLGCRVQVESNLSLTQSTWERKRGSATVTLAVYNPQFGISVAPEYEHRLSFRSPSTHDATITLQDVGFADSGVYICKVATFPLGNTQAATTLSVMVEPKIYVSAGSVPLLDGGNETLVATCTAERARPPAEVIWETGLSGRSEASVREELNGTSTTQVRYTWRPVRHAHGHALTCVVRHPALQRDFRIPYLLNVQSAPDIVLGGYHGDWFVGQENVELQCRADANPPPRSFTWTRLGGGLPDSVEVVNNHTLVFLRPLQLNDSGLYRCEVGNDIGLRSRDFDIRIQHPFQRYEASLVAVSGAVIGAILALFLITVFTIVTLMACRSHPPTYPDKVIDLPPMHKPHPPYTQRPLAFASAVNHMPVTQQILPVCLMDRQSEMAQRAPMRAAPFKSPHSPAHKPPPNQEWTCYQKGVDRVYINHREQYV